MGSCACLLTSISVDQFLVPVQFYGPSFVLRSAKRLRLSRLRAGKDSWNRSTSNISCPPDPEETSASRLMTVSIRFSRKFGWHQRQADQQPPKSAITSPELDLQLQGDLPMMAEKDAERGSVQKGTAPDSEHHCSRVRTFSASYVVYLFNARQLSITARYIYIYIYIGC